MALPLSLRAYALSEDSLPTFIQSSFDEFHRRKASYRMQSEPPPTITPWYLVLLPKLKADAQLIQTPLPVPKEYKTTFYLYKIFVAISVKLRTNIIASKTKRMWKIYKNALHNVFNSIQSRKKEQITHFPPPISPTSMTFCVGNYNEKCNFFFLRNTMKNAITTWEAAKRDNNTDRSMRQSWKVLIASSMSLWF